MVIVNCELKKSQVKVKETSFKNHLSIINHQLYNMKTLFCIGELLIDWISTDIDSSLVDSVNFIKKAGGAPGNAAISCNRLGRKSAFAGK